MLLVTFGRGRSRNLAPGTKIEIQLSRDCSLALRALCVKILCVSALSAPLREIQKEKAYKLFAPKTPAQQATNPAATLPSTYRNPNPDVPFPSSFSVS